MNQLALDVFELVSAVCNVDFKEVIQEKKSIAKGADSVKDAKAIAIYFLREYFEYSTRAIEMDTGGIIDHSTVTYSVNKVNRLILVEKGFKVKFEMCKQVIEEVFPSSMIHKLKLKRWTKDTENKRKFGDFNLIDYLCARYGLQPISKTVEQIS